MEYMSFSRLLIAVSLILIYVIQKLVGLAHQATPLNLKPFNNEDMDVRHLAYEDQLQFIDPDDADYGSVLLFELNERHGCLGTANYSVIRTFSAVNVGQMVLQIRGFRIGSSSSASNILRSRLYNIAKASKTDYSSNSNHNNNLNKNSKQSYYNHPHNYQEDHNHGYQQDQQQQQHQSQRSQLSEDHKHQQSICHGYGFTIYDCEPFDLEPNREHKIKIAFNPDFTLTKSIVSLTILTNLGEEFRFALVASIPRNLLATCNQSLPRPEWEPTMHLILAVGMVVLILISILIAYMEAILYLRSQQTTVAHNTCYTSSLTQSNHHDGGSNNDYERNHNCPNHSAETCNKDRTNGNGHGTSAISASLSSNQSPSHQPFIALNAKGSNGSSNMNMNKSSSNNNHNNNNKTNNYNNQKKRKNSSTVNNNEKVPNNSNNKSMSSNANDKKSSNSYAPIFQNLTNVIASPPPPLPTFDSEFDSLEFKKLRGKKSAKKSNSLNGSIASSDDIGNPSSLSNVASSNHHIVKTKSEAKSSNGLRTNGCISAQTERDSELQSHLETGPRNNARNRKGSLKDAFTSTSLSDEELNCNNFVRSGSKHSRNSHGRTPANDAPNTVTPIQPPISSTPSSTSSSASTASSKSSSTASSASSTSSSTTSSTSSSSTSSASSSPPLSASSYGEYSLLGPGASFELPCLRVRSAQTCRL